ncbi:MAG: phasin family protein [Hoeflea sp.]|uniref:phasin family protein n=1 Tax=Hoeflea sp. TaxID=1940281 RepID=UPI001D3F3581|nr:phasin family protein [Hoeflea sp.]MBU4529669.1 phasin family protein [Alphaproteobacteria bacterium]MBU4546788.1 phasin family protein [Alphaproteobacteria bacterium]MBU4551056.1 phasin family protein [Alphaproteobacteria bacterium]MBV1723998.1 phasin family protein [Hoeflea sp.]MBV1763275.1 phasin family protein [Hoeflea sp.]
MMNFDSTSKMSKEAMDSMLTTVSSMTKGFQQIAAEATEYSKKSYEDGAAAAEKLASAKSLDKAIEIQTDYAKSAYETFVAQATKMGELYADLAKEAYKPFETAAAKVSA